MISNNKRIAKNTLFLYFRMLLIMGVSLYTVRVVLETLGVVDYGIYNVVGGIISILSFFSGTMASASQRFFSFELGRNNIDQLNKTFSAIITLYILFAFVILILAETVGLWFLNTQMTIPQDRLNAAHWVYHFSVLSFMFTMFCIPYNALIIAHENMKIYAYVSIFEAFLKLALVYVLVFFSCDKLILYAILMFIVTLLATFTYIYYCFQKFKESHVSLYWDRKLYKEIVSYSGWNLFGALAGIFNGQGINILLNVFFGPTVNAARGVAFQVNNAINSFVQNFILASKPQITKYYALGETDEMLKLVFKSSKFSYFLLFALSMPILLEAEFVLSLWLTELPNYLILFVKLTIIATLIDSLSYSLMAAAQATGRVKVYQIVAGGFMLLNLPVSFFFLKNGFGPTSVFYIAIFSAFICLFIRLFLLKNLIGLSIKSFVKNVLNPILLSSLIAYIIPIFLIFSMDMGWLRFFLTGTVGLLISFIVIFFVGIDSSERQYVIAIVRRVLNLKNKE